jgi:hypothetical protein
MTQIAFLPANHAAQRVGEQTREMLIQAQKSVISRAFSDAEAFCTRVCQDLRV